MKLSGTQILERRIMRRFAKGCKRYDLLSDGDRILIAVSGGKDSLSLLDILARRAKVFRPHFEIIAAHVRIGNVDYESDAAALADFAHERGVRLITLETSFAEQPESRKTVCFLCSWNRRKALFRAAQELNCNKIALGHHQDDILHTLLLNLLFEGRFATMPVRLEMRKMPLTIIRPLCMVPEADLREYAEAQGFPRQKRLCPYEKATQRAVVRRLFAEMEQINPETRFSMWNALDKAGKLTEGISI